MRENVGELLANISYFSKSGIWLGKILVDGVRFAKVFPHQDFGIWQCKFVTILEICYIRSKLVGYRKGIRISE